MTEIIEQIAKDIDAFVLERGALRLIHFNEIAKVIEVCRSEGILILGIEAFKLGKNQVIPDTDFIADFSELVSEPWKAACVEAANSAQAYMLSVKNRTELWFDFTLKRSP